MEYGHVFNIDFPYMIFKAVSFRNYSWMITFKMSISSRLPEVFALATSLELFIIIYPSNICMFLSTTNNAAHVDKICRIKKWINWGRQPKRNRQLKFSMNNELLANARKYFASISTKQLLKSVDVIVFNFFN